MLCANDCRSDEPRKLAVSLKLICRTTTMFGMSQDGVVGHALGDPMVAAEQLEDPGLIGVGDAEAARRAGSEPGLRHLAEERDRLAGGGALLEDGVPDLAAVALLDERIGGRDGLVQRGGGAEVHSQLLDVDAALGDAAQREDPDVLVVSGVAGDDLQVRVVVGRPVVVVAHEDRAVRGGVLARQDEVAPMRRGSAQAQPGQWASCRRLPDLPRPQRGPRRAA